MKSKMFIKDESIDIDIFVVSRVENGDIISVSGNEMDETNFGDVFQQDKLSFSFSKPNYGDMSKYRQLSMYYDKNSDHTVVNPVRMRELFLMYHLRKWNLTDENGDEIVINIDPDGSLDTKCLNVIREIDFQIIDVLMTTFETKINFI